MATYRLADKILTTSAVPATEAAGIFYGTVWTRDAADPQTASKRLHAVPADTEPEALRCADAYIAMCFPDAVKQ